jgi:hypothetical protein
MNLKTLGGPSANPDKRQNRSPFLRAWERVKTLR